MNDLITVKPNRTNSGYIFTIKNTPEGKTFIRNYRMLRKSRGESLVKLRGRNPDRKQFAGRKITGRALQAAEFFGKTRYTAGDLRQDLPHRFATHFDVYHN